MDAEAEAPILWPPDVKSWFNGKDPDAGKDWRHWLHGAFNSGTIQFPETTLHSNHRAVAVWIPHDPPTRQWKPDGLQSRSGLQRSCHSATPQLLYLASVLIILHRRVQTISLSRQQCSHVNTLIQDLVFPRLILVSGLLRFGLMSHFYDMFHVI